LLSVTVFAQRGTVYKSHSHVLEYRFLEKDNNYRKVFRLLSINNEKNINTLKLEVYYKQEIKVKDNKIEIFFSKPSIKGNIFFRDFAIDTMLIPDRIQILINQKKPGTDSSFSDRYSFKFPGTISIKTGKKNILPTDIQYEFDLSTSRLKNFIEYSEKINQYYGYYTILKNLKKTFLTNEENSIDILYDYDLLHRINSNIKTNNIPEILNLKNHDPKGFVSLYNKAKRQERRKRTLTWQFIAKDLKTEKDKLRFADNVIKISTSFLSKKANHQPYIAYSFEQMAHLIKDPVTTEFYNTICKKLDKNTPGPMPAVDLVFNGFLKQSEIYNRQESFAYALIMLKNTIVWANITGIKKEKEIKPYINSTIDGMLSAYASIAKAAFQHNNFSMGNNYLAKTKKYYLENMEEFPFIDDFHFEKFQRQILDITETEINQNNYQSALDILFSFKDIHYTQNNRVRINNLKSTAYKGLYKQYFRRVSTSFNNGHIHEAYKRLLELNTFQKQQEQYLSSVNNNYKKKIQKIAYGLILEYLQTGEILWDNGKFTPAMKNYGIAENIQNLFLDYKIERLQTLLNQTAIPVVLNKIKSADLEIWANRLSNAKALYDEANEIVTKYNLIQVDTVRTSLSKLKNKLDNKNCVNTSRQIKDNIRVIKNRTQSYKWDEALKRFNQTLKIYAQNRSCQFDSSDFIRFRSKYHKIFSYLTRSKTAENMLIAKGYQKTWKNFAILDTEYYHLKYKDLGIPDPGLYRLLKSQKNPENIKTVVSYFLEHHETELALKYLSLLEKLKFTDKETKELLKTAGKQMVSDKKFDLYFKDFAKENSKWFKPLINSYLDYLN
jgi:hypothetical protein